MGSPSKPRRKHLVLRTLLVLVMTCIAWWLTHHYTQPKPLFTITGTDRHTLRAAMLCSRTCFMELGDDSRRRDMSHVASYDLDKKTYTKRDTLFNNYGWAAYIVPVMTNLADRYAVTLMDHRLTIYDAVTRTSEAQAFTQVMQSLSNFVQLSDDGTTVLQATILPSAPFTLLAPLGWSGLTTACLSCCDEQRFFRQPFGPTLIQVMSLPDRTITSRFTLPATAVVRFPRWTADGKHLFHGFHLQYQSHLPFAYQSFWQHIYLPSIDHLERMFSYVPEILYLREGYLREQWREGPLIDIWPATSSRFDVYDGRTGEHQRSFETRENGIPVHYRAMELRNEWVFLSKIVPLTSKEPGKSLPPLFAYHLPTGRTLAASDLPIEFWIGRVSVERAPDNKAHAVVTIGSTNTLSGLFRAGVPLPKHLYTFTPDGSIVFTSELANTDSIQLVPHSDQYVSQHCMLDLLPPWCVSWVNKWPQLRQKLNTPRFFVKTSDGQSLSSFDGKVLPDDPSIRRFVVSRDGRLLFIPVQHEYDETEYDAYALPLLTMLPWYPRLAAFAVVLLMFLYYLWLFRRSSTSISHALPAPLPSRS
ncbi:MAG: hypothetical protein U0796_01515 [Gemmatales bacterium]